MRRLTLLACLAASFGLGCRQDMHDQPRYKPYASSDFFGDHRSARPLVEGTVARGELRDDEQLYAGRIDGQLADSFPFRVTAEAMARGRERFDVFCAPCHGRTGDGNGIVVQRGYRQAQSLHIERLRGERVGYFFDVITRGFGAMPDYAAQIPVRDRWAIVAYVRALQLSQNAVLDDVPSARRGELERAGEVP